MTDILYVDRATPAALRTAAAWKTELGGVQLVRALEPLGTGASQVDVAQFFAGDLATPDGEAVSLASYRMAGEVAMAAARQILACSPALAGIDDRLGRGTVRLHIAKRCWGEAQQKLVRMLVARALGAGSDGVTLMLEEPQFLPAATLTTVVPGLTVVWYRGPRTRIRRWLGVARSIGGIVRRRARRTFGGMTAAREPIPRDLPAVLELHEDVLTEDRSIRSQPYWVDASATGAPTLRVLVMPTNEPIGQFASPGLRRAAIHPLSDAAVRDAETRDAGRVGEMLRHEMLEALRVVADPDRCVAAAGAAVTVLLDASRTVEAVAREYDVRCFHASDPHLLQADAMAIVAEAAKIPMITRQYSNLAAFSPPMCSTADHFILFSAAFESLWSRDGARPLGFREGGYVFDGAFSRVRRRSAEIRDQLANAGARTVICYFDESVQAERYGVISEAHHRDEVLALAAKLLERPDWGVVVKTQFEFNSPSKRYANEPTFREAQRTGRYVELRRGAHRNVVFPAEAALASDVCVGHIVGATAPLEAALAGVRSVMIDRYRQVRFRRELYDRAPIVFPSMHEALGAVERWRAGDPASRDVGDWSTIIGEFDPFRDGRSSDRMRALIEEVVRAPRVKR